MTVILIFSCDKGPAKEKIRKDFFTYFSSVIHQKIACKMTHTNMKFISETLMQVWKGDTAIQGIGKFKFNLLNKGDLL